MGELREREREKSSASFWRHLKSHGVQCVTQTARDITNGGLRLIRLASSSPFLLKNSSGFTATHHGDNNNNNNKQETRKGGALSLFVFSFFFLYPKVAVDVLFFPYQTSDDKYIAPFPSKDRPISQFQILSCIFFFFLKYSIYFVCLFFPISNPTKGRPCFSLNREQSPRSFVSNHRLIGELAKVLECA